MSIPDTTETGKMPGSDRKITAGTGIPVPGDDIDTDRIIPARYLKCVTFESLGAYAFYDERFDESGGEKDHPLNNPAYRGHQIMLVNKNFGCGSSREHAPQSLMRMGIRALVGESFAEIFSGNCTSLGIPAVRVSGDVVRDLMSMVEKDPETEITIDLERNLITAESAGIRREYGCEMPEASRRSLVTGSWDTMGTLLSGKEDVLRRAAELPYLRGFS